MPDKEEIRKRRSGALMAQLNIGPDDRIFDMVPRQSGLHMVTLEKIIKVNLPDEIDPEIEFSDAPIAQILVANVGSRSPIVARTILQSKDFSGLHRESSRPAIQEIAWRVMESLLAFDRTIASIQRSIDTVKKTIEIEFERYVVGSSPSHPPIAEGVEADFRSAVLLSHAALNDVSELFPLILAAKCKRGRYDQIIAWSKETFGENDVLSLMLQADHRWIYLWGEVRNAFEHPNPSYYVQVNNFRILASREIQLPTWQMKHPRLDVFKPQNMVQSLVLHRDNILSFFENLLLVMTDKTITFPVEFIDQEEEHRDPDCPKRYGFAGS